MKKIAGALILLLFLGLPIYVYGSGFKLMFAPTITNLNISEDISPTQKKPLFQYSWGLGLELDFTNSLALEVDLMYAPGGARFEYEDAWGWYKVDYKGYGVSLPILLKVSLVDVFFPFIFAVVGGTLTYTQSQMEYWETSSGSGDYDMTDEVNRFQYGLCFGGGAQLYFGSLGFSLEGRYGLGLSNLLKDPPPGESVKYTSFLILFCLLF